MAKKEKVAAKAEEATPAVASVPTAMTDTPVEEAKTPKKGNKISFDVYKDNTLVRTYSVEVHGKDAEDLAEEYAKKIGGSVK